MERTALPRVAAPHAVGQAASGVRGLRRRLEPLTLAHTAVARWTEIGAYAAALAAGLLFSSLALARHRQFESTAYDFGFFDQIIWNTSQGRWFQTSFTPYNFLGQHVQPVLLPFALAYRLGAGIELLLIIQTIFIAMAALPLFYAVRLVTSSGCAALAMTIAFLLSPQLHRALDFDFHPELMGFFFVFLALYLLVASRPATTIIALLPLLLLKEDMPLILAAFAVLLFLRGFRRAGLALIAFAAAYAATVVFILMPWIRGGSGDLTGRYGYLVADSTWWSIVPDVVSRSLQQLWIEPLAAALRLGGSTGFVGLLSPIALLVAAPSYLLAALSDHQTQSQLKVHYAMAPLALAWVAAALGVQRVAHTRWPAWTHPRRTASISAITSAIVLACSVAAFLAWSPYSPRTERVAPDAAHRAVIREALRVVPAGVPVSAQNTLLPHLSMRESIFEFPNLGDAEYVIVDPSLPITSQSRQAGYDSAIKGLPNPGFELIFDREGVKVFRRVP